MKHRIMDPSLCWDYFIAQDVEAAVEEAAEVVVGKPIL